MDLKQKHTNYKRKVNDHEEVIIETQQVSLPHFINKTLEGKVDLKKIQEIKKALYRRYGNSKNLQKIFNAWDENNIGKINCSNLQNMLNKIGLQVNNDEAKILMAFSDKNGDDCLSIDEFHHFIFNPRMDFYENTNLLSKLKYYAYDIKDSDLFKRDNKHNKFNLILKNEFSDLRANFINYDKQKSPSSRQN